MIAGVIGGAVAAVAFIAYLRAIWKYSINRAAIGVVRALRRNPNQPYIVRIHKWVPMIGAWNPSQPLRRNGQVFGDGTATYRIDINDGTDEVTLTWEQRTGGRHEYHGDVPEQIDPGHPDQRKRTLVLRGVGIVYAAASVGGFAAGYLLSSGTPGRRAGFGLLGVFVAMVALWFVITAFSVGNGTRKVLAHRHQRGEAQSASDDNR